MCFKYIGLPHFLVLLSFLQFIMSATSCTVKEDRDLCPSLLELDFFRGDAFRLSEGIRIGLDYEGTQIRDTVLYESSEDNFAYDEPIYTWKTTVPRTSMIVSAVWPTDACVGSGNDAIVKIRPGYDCPRVWMYVTEVSAECDFHIVDVILHKNYCELSVSVRNISGEDFPFRMELRGNVCGYSCDGTPLSGLFVTPFEDNVCLPRQIDNSLRLDVISDDDTVCSFAIGNYIEASGYDWSSEDLKDIAMEIDYARTSFKFRIGLWEKKVNFEVVI